MGLSAKERALLEGLLRGLPDAGEARARLEREEEEARAAEGRARRARVSRIFRKKGKRSPAEAAAARERAEAEEARKELEAVNARWRGLEEAVASLEEACGAPPREVEPRLEEEVSLLSGALESLLELRETGVLRRRLRASRSLVRVREAKGLRALGRHAPERPYRVGARAPGGPAVRPGGMPNRELVGLAMDLARGLHGEDPEIDGIFDALEALLLEAGEERHWAAVEEALAGRLRDLWRRDLVARAEALLG